MWAYLNNLAVLITINAILAVTLNFVLGYAGIFSMAHAAFFGIGSAIQGARRQHQACAGREKGPVALRHHVLDRPGDVFVAAAVDEALLEGEYAPVQDSYPVGFEQHALGQQGWQGSIGNGHSSQMVDKGYHAGLVVTAECGRAVGECYAMGIHWTSSFSTVVFLY